jgi:hypothetical protein
MTKIVNQIIFSSSTKIRIWGGWFMVFSATFNDISVRMYIVAVSFFGGGKLRKPPARRKDM